MAEPVLRARNLSAGYAQRPVLEGVSFDLRRGAFTFIVGANGSGKSTLLKTLAGALPPLKGTVERVARRVGYVPQRHAIDSIFLLTALDVVLMGASAHRRAGAFLRESDRTRAKELLKTAAGNVGDQQFARLSGGQQQRTLIARGLMTDPELLLLDEPTAGVDATSAASILQWLRELNDGGLTIALVTHHLAEIRNYATDLLCVSAGQVAQRPVEELRQPGKLEELLLQ